MAHKIYQNIQDTDQLSLHNIDHCFHFLWGKKKVAHAFINRQTNHLISV